MENEIWKDIPGYDGYYQVSSYGNVRSLERPYTICSKTIISTKSKILKQGIVKGYYNVELNVNGVAKKIFVHRLVALAFIPNINNLPCINHKDENATGIKRQNISKVILGKRHTAGGYIWKKGGSK